MNVIKLLLETDMPSKLWDIANYVTGFVISQGLVLAIAFGSSKEMRAISPRRLMIKIIVAATIIMALYTRE
jgi:hypothetical protein